MQQTNLDRLAEFLRSRGISAALLSSPWTIAWLTGLRAADPDRPQSVRGRPGAGLVVRRRADPDRLGRGGRRGARPRASKSREYVGYTIDEPLDVVERQAAVLQEVLGGWARPRRDRGGRAALPARRAAGSPCTTALPGATLRPVDGELEPLRAVKTPEEIAKLRAALALCDQSQADVQMSAPAGRQRDRAVGRDEGAAGGRRRADVCRCWPTWWRACARARWADCPAPTCSQEGDPVIADIVPRLDGYWGDICGTHFVGEPPAEMAKHPRDRPRRAAPRRSTRCGRA